jgi:N-acetyl-gamma-glutamyl-phosphate reductase
MKRVAIIGAGGYSGAELVSILLNHPAATIVGLYGSAKREQGKDAQTFSSVFPRFRGRLDLPLLATDLDHVASTRPDAVFLATPHEASVELAAGLLDLGLSVLDLSAAFRFRNPAVYPTYYGFDHHDPRQLDRSVYGLPELYRALLSSADLIAVPGCYPTSAILPLSPLVRAGAVREDARGICPPIITSTSGVSGAGRALKQSSLFCEVSLQPYAVFSHRHTPEISTYCGAPVVFTPHLGSFVRGILSTIHVELADGWSAQRIGETLHRTYDAEPFVRLCPPGVWPAIADVTHTNFCDIGWAVDPSGRHLILVSAIDNLVKGAAGQAVQCMNIRLGLDERLSLLPAFTLPADAR